MLVGMEVFTYIMMGGDAAFGCPFKVDKVYAGMFSLIFAVTSTY